MHFKHPKVIKSDVDHYEAVYLHDLKILEVLGSIQSGTMIVADNVIRPGVSDYAEYVRNNPNYTSTLYESNLEYKEDVLDGVEASVRNEHCLMMKISLYSFNHYLMSKLPDVCN